MIKLRKHSIVRNKLVNDVSGAWLVATDADGRKYAVPECSFDGVEYRYGFQVVKLSDKTYELVGSQMPVEWI